MRHQQASQPPGPVQVIGAQHDHRPTEGTKSATDTSIAMPGSRRIMMGDTVELDDHTRIRPGGVHAGDEPALTVSDRVLECRLWEAETPEREHAVDLQRRTGVLDLGMQVIEQRTQTWGTGSSGVACQQLGEIERQRTIPPDLVPEHRLEDRRWQRPDEIEQGACPGRDGDAIHAIALIPEQVAATA